MWHTQARSEMYKEFYLRTLKERNHLEDLGLDGRIIKWLLKK
jgi:hypothetical protein